MSKPQIYTSYYGNHKQFPKGSILISISRTNPTHFVPGYSLEEAKPTGYLVWGLKNHSISKQEYKDLYLRYLNQHKTTIINKVKAFLDVLPPTVDKILLCYEKPLEFCHRHILAQFLRENGISCEEYPNKYRSGIIEI